MAQNAAASGATASGASMLQVMLGLGLVLAVMAGCAWLLRRFGGLQRGAGGAIKIIGASAVGQRERVVLVEVADSWLVIGYEEVKAGRTAEILNRNKQEAERAFRARDYEKAARLYGLMKDSDLSMAERKRHEIAKKLVSQM